jgi:hypothetical protein
MSLSLADFASCPVPLAGAYSVTNISRKDGKDREREMEITGAGTREKLLIGF